MRRDFEAYLWDIQDAGESILRFTVGMSGSDFDGNSLVQAAVERKFAIVGEALVQAKHHFPDRIAAIDDFGKIIAFRNQLVHNYDDIKPPKVWEIIESSLPILLRQVSELLGPPIEE